MSAIRQEWTRIARFVGDLEGIDDAGGDYLFVLGRRMGKLERDFQQLERQLNSHTGGAIQR